MKNLLRILCCAVVVAASLLTPVYSHEEPTGACRIHCADGSSYFYCDVIYARCRTRFNELCGGVGSYLWTQGGTCP